MQHEKRGFGYVYKDFMRNPNITVEAKAIFNYLSSFAGDKGECFPGKEMMLNELNISEQRFDKHMKILISNGYIIKIRLRVKGKLSNNTYKINVFPIANTPCDKVLDHENPCLEILGVENPCQENKGININSSNTNSINSNSKERSACPKKHKYGEYKHVTLTDEERERLISELGQDMFDKCIVKLDEYIELKKPKYNNHNLVIRKWVIKAVQEDDEKKGGSKTYDQTSDTGNCYTTDYYEQFKRAE